LRWKLSLGGEAGSPGGNFAARICRDADSETEYGMRLSYAAATFF
jgi:hypothetical protein